MASTAFVMTIPTRPPTGSGERLDPPCRPLSTRGDIRYPAWKSLLVYLSIWTDPHYVLYRARRFARRWHVRDREGSTPRSATPVTTRDRSGQDGAELEGLEVDLVYMWVDGADPAHRAKRAEWLAKGGLDSVTANPDVRYVEHDELRYSLRSAEKFLPWVRRIFIVTDSQRPTWLAASHPRLAVVDHRDIATDSSDLPTFNSKVIFTWLRNIPGLAEHFIVADDDTFFGQPCVPGDFFGVLEGEVVMRVMSSDADSGWIVPVRQAGDDPLARLWMAGWNNTKLLLEGRRPWRRMRRLDLHQAYAMTRSAMARAEERYARSFARVRRNRFRDISDVQLSALVRYGELFDGRALPGHLPSRVFGGERELATSDLSSLPTLFCVNGGSGGYGEGAPRELERLFPRRSAFERVSQA